MASPTKVERELRRQQAMSLRVGGATFEQIGQALKITKASAYKLVMRTLEDTRVKTAQDAAALKDLANARIEDAIFRISRQVQAGNLGAVDRLIRLLDRQARLNGLDAPYTFAAELPPGVAPSGDGGEVEGAIVSGLIAIVPAKVATPEAWAAKYSPTKTTEPTPPS